MKTTACVTVLILLSMPGRAVQDIFEAVRSGNLAQTKSLLDANPGLVKAADQNGRTPLHWAAENGYVELARLLLERGADVNARTASKNTPLHSAVFKGYEDIVKLLVENGADVNVEGEFDYPPLFYAMLADRPGIICTLIENKANPLYRNKTGQMAIHLALIRNKKEAVSALLALGVDIPAEGEDGRFLIHRAAAIGHERLVNYLIDKGADLATLNNDGGMLLHSASMGGLVGLLKELVQKGAHVNAKNRYGLTPIHLAAMEGHKEAVDRLIELGADLSLAAPDGKNAADYADDFGHEEIVQLLKRRDVEPDAKKFTRLEGDYLGQDLPGLKPRLFALGVASTIHYDHCAPEFSADGKEVYLSSAYTSRGDYVFSMKSIRNRWTIPRIEPFCLLNGGAMYPTLSKDGKRLYFVSDRALDGKSNGKEGNIWFAERQADGWSEPRYIGFEGGDEYGLSISQDGTLYFMALYDWGKGSADLFRSRLIDGKYAAPENLGQPVNTEFYEDEPYIAPDESYIIFHSTRPDEFDKAGIFMSRRKDNGQWTQPKNIASRLGLDGAVRFPKISPDGRFFFFASNQNGNWDIYWVDARIIEELRLKDRK